MPKFTIILPVKNGMNYIGECVKGILSQTYQDFELLVLDNNSSDGTLKWISSINDKRIRIEPSSIDLSMQQNWGRAVDLGLGEYVTFTGHDDVYYPDFLQTIDRLMGEYPDARLYQTHYHFIGSDGKEMRKCMHMDSCITAAAFLHGQMAREMDSMGTGYVFKSSYYHEVGGICKDYPNLIFADYELWLKLISDGYMAVAPEFCFGYRIHNNISKSTDAEEYRKAFEKYLVFLKDFSKGKPSVQEVIENDGSKFLNYFCSSLSHRLLKFPEKSFRIPIAHFIENCKSHAADLGVKRFNAATKPGIMAALIIDTIPALHHLFQKYKSIR